MTQEEVGSFGAGLCYWFAKSRLDFYYRGLTASLAVLAKELDQLRSQQEQEMADETENLMAKMMISFSIADT